MDDRVATRCSRCEADIVVLTAGEYLSISNADLDFTLHAGDRNLQLAIKSEEGSYACLICGKHERLPPPQKGP